MKRNLYKHLIILLLPLTLLSTTCEGDICQIYSIENTTDETVYVCQTPHEVSVKDAFEKCRIDSIAPHSSIYDCTCNLARKDVLYYHFIRKDNLEKATADTYSKMKFDRILEISYYQMRDLHHRIIFDGR